MVVVVVVVVAIAVGVGVAVVVVVVVVVVGGGVVVVVVILRQLWSVDTCMPSLSTLFTSHVRVINVYDFLLLKGALIEPFHH
jgi:hypothetical protein